MPAPATTRVIYGGSRAFRIFLSYEMLESAECEAHRSAGPRWALSTHSAARALTGVLPAQSGGVFGKGYAKLKDKLHFDEVFEKKVSATQRQMRQFVMRPGTYFSRQAPEFPLLLSQVDLKKVKMEIMKPWITQRVTDLMGFEDELVVNFVFAQLEPEGLAEGVAPTLDPKDMQINLMGFMEKKAAPFMTELWGLLYSASKSSNGIPPEFLERKKAELRQKKEERERLKAEIEARKAEVEAELAEVRRMQREQEEAEAEERGEAPPPRPEPAREEPRREDARRDEGRRRDRDDRRDGRRDSRRNSRRERHRSRSRDRRRDDRRDRDRRRSPSPRRPRSESASRVPPRDASPEDSQRRRRSPNPTPQPSESARRSPSKELPKENKRDRWDRHDANKEN